ncbi:MAG: sel1 repeat family protein [Rhodospirillaceae bacterium]|jgi:uncharacterized protein|nr:sel1 repeat family protein [Rhodospirillaceae bacterium]
MRRTLALLAFGLFWLTPAAQADGPLAALESYFEFAAKGAETDTRDAVLARLDGLSQAGDGAASSVLGLLYEVGQNGYPRDMKKAIAYYERALEQNRDFIAARLGYLYLYGINVPRDKEKAQVLFRRAQYRIAAEPKQIRSILFEGVMLISRPFPPEFDEALAWAQAMREETAENLFRASEELSSGRKELRDDRLAAFLMAEAADKGHPIAQYRLAQLILAEAEAADHLLAGLSYLHEAAARGVVEAQVDLGQRYLAGRDMAPDDVKAFYWLSRAHEAGADVAFFLGDLSAALSPADRATADGWQAARQYPPL